MPAPLQALPLHSPALPTAPPPARPARPPVALFQAVINGQFDPEVIAWLRTAFRQAERAAGALTLDRCLCLPTRKQQRREQRNYWLRQALDLVEGPSLNARLEALARELRNFTSLAIWPQWRAQGAAPLSATELQRCLFLASINHDGRRMPCVRTLDRVLAPASTNSDAAMSDATGQHEVPAKQ